MSAIGFNPAYRTNDSRPAFKSNSAGKIVQKTISKVDDTIDLMQRELQILKPETKVSLPKIKKNIEAFLSRQTGKKPFIFIGDQMEFFEENAITDKHSRLCLGFILEKKHNLSSEETDYISNTIGLVVDDIAKAKPIRN